LKANTTLPRDKHQENTISHQSHKMLQDKLKELLTPLMEDHKAHKELDQQTL